MAGELVQHVIQEGHAGSHLAAAAAIEVEGHPHVGFTSNAVDLADAIRSAHDGRGLGERAIMADGGGWGRAGAQFLHSTPRWLDGGLGKASI